MSSRTVFRWTFKRNRGGQPRELGRALGMDNDARRKGHHYNTLVVDLEQGQPIATFTRRQSDEVVAWFQSHPQAEPDRVEVVLRDRSKSF